ncbi:hypothetical protein JTE90_011065 [Oedothorax gibbosus]|uniref:BTB domain-containing protein n=1 Tax=Oedothorax gibbosus TaxID=931172 RepID=A0AAV6VCS1_9ARAC|nr:hypothetical protein JTE90_011065 [Oedothorax gibbosus]
MATRGESPRAALLPPAAPSTPRPSLSPNAPSLEAAYGGHFSITRALMDQKRDATTHRPSHVSCIVPSSAIGGLLLVMRPEYLTVSTVVRVRSFARHPDSRLARMFNGSIPIVLDSLKQHYFIDRDGKMFRHILNFMRTNNLSLPEDFNELDLLYEEARFYDIPAMVRQIEQLKRERSKKKVDATCSSSSSSLSLKNGRRYQDNQNECSSNSGYDSAGEYQCLALNVSPDLGERIVISGDRALVEEVFPEIGQPLMDARSSVAWNQDSKHVIRFPLNGYCKLNSLQTIVRLLNGGFRILASNGGGVEGQQFSEYLFVRKYVPL